MWRWPIAVLDLEARDVADLFETAALALVDLMVDPNTVA
jgi:SHS2 domain-containing protein